MRMYSSEKDVLESLKKLIGKAPMEEHELLEEIVIAFGDYEEDGKTEVVTSDICHCGISYLNAYINSVDSTEFCLKIEGRASECFAPADLFTVLDVWIV